MVSSDFGKLDVSRHFIPIDVLKRNLDGMAAVKMNVLHWHLSDDQGFRVESKKFPKLTQAGSDFIHRLRFATSSHTHMIAASA